MFDRDSNHFFKKNLENSTWDEFENNKSIKSFHLLTYISGGMILQSQDLDEFVELTDWKARTVLGHIEYLDDKLIIKGFKILRLS